MCFQLPLVRKRVSNNLLLKDETARPLVVLSHVLTHHESSGYLYRFLDTRKATINLIVALKDTLAEGL